MWPSRNKPLRKELVWTAKAKALVLMAVALHILVIITAGLIIVHLRPGLDNLFTAMIIALLVLLPFYFILFSIALLAIMPLDAYVKSQLVRKAKSKIKKLLAPSSALRAPSPSREKGKFKHCLIASASSSPLRERMSAASADR